MSIAILEPELEIELEEAPETNLIHPDDLTQEDIEWAVKAFPRD
jgi:hypothetical protein